jgi:hypothetical protein
MREVREILERASQRIHDQASYGSVHAASIKHEQAAGPTAKHVHTVDVSAGSCAPRVIEQQRLQTAGRRHQAATSHRLSTTQLFSDSRSFPGRCGSHLSFSRGTFVLGGRDRATRHHPLPLLCSRWMEVRRTEAGYRSNIPAAGPGEDQRNSNKWRWKREVEVELVV